MKRTLLVVPVFLLAVAALAQNPNYVADPKWVAPPDAVSKTNPLAGKDDAIAGGKKLYMRNCSECHGDDGQGTPYKHSADFRLDSVQSQSDGALFWKITNGNLPKKMPSFSRLPELQRWQLVLYIRSLRDATP